jgi:hypothetical protein
MLAGLIGPVTCKMCVAKCSLFRKNNDAKQAKRFAKRPPFELHLFRDTETNRVVKNTNLSFSILLLFREMFSITCFAKRMQSERKFREITVRFACLDVSRKSMEPLRQKP